MTSPAMNLRWPGARLGLLLGCLGFVAALRCEAQNLIFNPSFELVDTCPQSPIGYEPGQRPSGWFKVNGSPDYFTRCKPFGHAGGVPLNWFGWQEPIDGDAYSGMWTYFQGSNLWHEMIGADLVDPLEIGTTYYLSFYINAAAGGTEWPMLASSHFGALFTMDAQEWENDDPSWPLRNQAQVYHDQVMGDTANWLLVSGSFVADSAYRYIILGNHFSNAIAEADTIITQDSTAFLYRAYTYVDQLCLSVDPEGCPMAQGIDGLVMEPISVYPNPASGAIEVGGLTTEEEVMVVDGTGRVHWHGKPTGESLRVNVRTWARGCYFLMAAGTGGRRTLKFVLIE